MLNDSSCYYDAINNFKPIHFANDETRKAFTLLLEKQKNKDELLRNNKDFHFKTAVTVFDLSYQGKDNFRESVETFKQKLTKNRISDTLDKIKNNLDSFTLDEINNVISNELMILNTDKQNEDIIVAEERAPVALQEFHDRLENPDAFMGLPFSVADDRGRVSGLPSLDKAFHGAKGGDLIMLAAKTGVGKTALAINLTRHFSLDLNYAGYYMNTEMRIDEMEARLLGKLANVKANEILTGKIEGTADEIQRKINSITEAHDKYMKSKLYLSRIPNLPLHKAKGLAQQIKHQYKELDYVIVDYIGRMELDERRKDEWAELYEITKQLKELAMHLDVPIFMLAQRNQAGDVEGAKKMMNECDGVLFFEPVEQYDLDKLEGFLNYQLIEKINYKITKKKVRRDDNPSPVFITFDKSKNYINEVVV